MRLRHFSSLIALLLAALVLLPAFGQDAGSGRGVVRFADATLADGSWALANLLVPRLFDVDAQTGSLLGADRSDRALVEVVPPNLPSDEVTLRLRADRVWSDGEPITAYDVLFTLMATTVQSGHAATAARLSVQGVRLIDERTVALRFAMTDAELAELRPRLDSAFGAATCDDLPRANVDLLPVHTFAPDFRAFVEAHAPPVEQPSLTDWVRAYNTARMPSLYDLNAAPLTSGTYRRDDTYSSGSQRYVPADGTGAALERRLDLRVSAVEALIAGETNVLLDAPIEERAGLRALSDPNAGNMQIAEVPGREALIVLLNFANTRRPLPAFHPVTSEPLDQGQHPIFSDPSVRRALQLAIDPAPIVETTMQRSAVPLAGLFAPGSWVFDPTLQPSGTNIVEAEQLLDDAGWIDNGVVRQCVGCATAPDGTTLRFGLGSYSVDPEIADWLTRQWSAIGISVAAMGNDLYGLQSQTFDAYLLPFGGLTYESADPDPAWLLTPFGDSPFAGGDNLEFLMNYGSYNNPAVTDLIEQARTVPGCDTAARAALYHQLERVLQDDLPFLSVIAPTEFYAAAPNVIGFAPRTGDPLWNVEDWVIGADPS